MFYLLSTWTTVSVLLVEDIENGAVFPTMHLLPPSHRARFSLESLVGSGESFCPHASCASSQKQAVSQTNALNCNLLPPRRKFCFQSSGTLVSLTLALPFLLRELLLIKSGFLAERAQSTFGKCGVTYLKCMYLAEKLSLHALTARTCTGSVFHWVLLLFRKRSGGRSWRMTGCSSGCHWSSLPSGGSWSSRGPSA